MKLCRCVLTGSPAEMVAVGDAGHWRCRICGADEGGVREASRRVEEDWKAGGPGFRRAPGSFLGNLWARLRQAAHLAVMGRS